MTTPLTDERLAEIQRHIECAQRTPSLFFLEIALQDGPALLAEVERLQKENRILASEKAEDPYEIITRLQAEVAQARAASEAWTRLVDEHNMSGLSTDDILAKVDEKFKDSRKLASLEFYLKQWFDIPEEASGWNIKAMCERVKDWKRSTVQWVTVDSEKSNLPSTSGPYLFYQKGFGIIPGVVTFYPGEGWILNLTGPSDEKPVFISKPGEPGDRWAYIPQPPEEPDHD